MRFCFFLALVVGLSFLSSCHRQILSCRTQYLTPLYLASEQIDTPDPLRQCFFGQQLIVKWNIPRSCFEGSFPVLFLRVRYGTRENALIEVPIKRRFGYWVYQLINQDYWSKEGIVSYEAQLCKDGVLLDRWSHHLWAELIQI